MTGLFCEKPTVVVDREDAKFAYGQRVRSLWDEIAKAAKDHTDPQENAQQAREELRDVIVKADVARGYIDRLDAIHKESRYEWSDDDVRAFRKSAQMVAFDEDGYIEVVASVSERQDPSLCTKLVLTFCGDADRAPEKPDREARDLAHRLMTPFLEEACEDIDDAENAFMGTEVSYSLSIGRGRDKQSITARMKFRRVY